jgi:hypothetical protein
MDFKKSFHLTKFVLSHLSCFASMNHVLFKKNKIVGNLSLFKS